MEYLAFLIRRLFYSVFVLLGLSILIFTIARVMPGDPVRMALGPRVTKEAVERVRQEMHLDKPIFAQYYYWLVGVLHGDFGESLYTLRAVSEDVKAYLPATLELAAFASLLMVFGGIGLGVLGALFKDKWPDNSIRLFSYAGIALPSFVWAILLILFFGYYLRIFPITGRVSSGIELPSLRTGFVTLDALFAGQPHVFGDALRHLVLPSISLAMATIAQNSRLTRITMIENSSRDFIEAARSYGLPNAFVTSRLLLKPSLIPTVSILGLEIAAVISNAFLIELIFIWPGIARYGMQAILRKDLNAVVAVIMLMGVLFVILNFLVDIVVGYLDPRIRLRSRGGE